MKIEPIQFDYSSCLMKPRGLEQAEVDAFWPAFDAARREILEVDLPLWDSGNQIPVAKQPLDAGFVEMPDRMLDGFTRDPESSELARILATAKRIREQCDRVVVLGIGGSYMGAKALMDACCQPYFNYWSRGARGGRPRMFFAGNNLDNDDTQSLLELLKSEKDSEHRWAIVVISKSGGTIETAVAFRQFLRLLQEEFGPDAAAELVVPVTGESGKLASFADELGCQDRFLVPEGVGGRFSIFSAVGLLPASILGIDIIALLNGAFAINENFRTEPAGRNTVFGYVAVNQLMQQKKEVTLRLLSVWSNALEKAGFWHDQLFAESLGKQELGATPLTVVNTRDLHSRTQQHQEGKRDKMINNLVVDNWRYDPLAVGKNELDVDELNELAEKTLPELMTAAIQGTNQAYREDNRATADIRLPRCDEPSLGQFFQMMMLATVVEGRLMGINPYGQPGVENYKKNMKAILQR